MGQKASTSTTYTPVAVTRLFTLAEEAIDEGVRDFTIFRDSTEEISRLVADYGEEDGLKMWQQLLVLHTEADL